MYSSLYPWPLNKFIYYSEYYFIQNKLKSNQLWNLDRKQVIMNFFFFFKY